MTLPLAEALHHAATNALVACLGLKDHETVLVVTDAGCRVVGEALVDAAGQRGNPALLLEIPRSGVSGAEPPAPVAAAMAAAAVVLCPTTRSLTHTAARRQACAAGARVATLPGITADCMVRCLAADYEAIARVTERLAALLTAGRVARLTCPHGTDLTLPIGGIRALASTGLIRAPGEGGNLPSGEAYLRPCEGETDGVLYVDGSFADVGLIGAEPLRLEVREGHVVSLSGGPEAARLEALLAPHGRDARNVAELGVGTNDRARLTGLVLEDEKVAGTVHVALGNNVGMGGTVAVPLHLDGVLRRPTLTVDGVVIVAEGRLCGEAS